MQEEISPAAVGCTKGAAKAQMLKVSWTEQAMQYRVKLFTSFKNYITFVIQLWKKIIHQLKQISRLIFHP